MLNKRSSYKPLDLVEELTRLFILFKTRKFYIRKNNNKVDSVEARRVVIADVLPGIDLKKYMYTTLF